MSLKNILIFLTAIQILSADIRFFPRIIYVDSSERSSTIYLQNPSDEKKSYKLYFGYTDMTEDGKFVPKEENELSKHDRNGCKWLKIFPKRITLNSQEKQSVRLSVNVPKGTEESEYYCRLYAKSQPVAKELDTNNPDVKAVISTVMIIGAPIHIRNGTNELNVTIDPQITKIDSERLYLTMNVQNSGITGFRGNLVMEITDGKENTYKKKEKSIIFQSLNRKIEESIDISSMPAGKKYINFYLADSTETPEKFKLIKDLPLKIGEFVFEKQ